MKLLLTPSSIYPFWATDSRATHGNPEEVSLVPCPITFGTPPEVSAHFVIMFAFPTALSLLPLPLIEKFDLAFLFICSN